MYWNIPGKGRRKTRAYTQWINGELKALLAQKAKPFIGPAIISITVPNHTRRDADNYAKPILDLMVRAGVLAGDRSDCVRSISVSFSPDCQCAHVKIEAA
jgi:Holliday junction resolvase RusA-like endonuclease